MIFFLSPVNFKILPTRGPRYFRLFDIICECDEILKLYIGTGTYSLGMKKFLSETTIELTINKIK